MSSRRAFRLTTFGAAVVFVAATALSVGVGTAQAVAVPVLTAQGPVVSWAPVATAEKYVLALKVPGRADHYEQVACCSVTITNPPRAVMTVGLRTDVEGSVWAKELKLDFSRPAARILPARADTSTGAPQAGAPRTAAPAAPRSTAVASRFQIGMVGGSDTAAAQRVALLGAKVQRAEFEATASSSTELEAALEAAAANGIRLQPLVGWENGTPAPDMTFLGEWAKRYGPGGTFWAGRSDALAITEIELGNENSFSYKSGQNDSAGYAALATTYGTRAVAAARAVQSSNPGVGVLVELDSDGGGSEWTDATLAAGGPDLITLMRGPVMHKYGPDWKTAVDRNVAHAAANGLNKPYWLTEWGIATDNGANLSDNYGFPTGLTYSQAGSLATSILSAMATDSRIHQVLVYQHSDQKVSGDGEREHYFGVLKSDGSPKPGYTEAITRQIALHP